MGFLSGKSRRPKAIVDSNVLAALTAYGQASLDARRVGQPVTDPRFGWDNFHGPVCMSMTGDDRDQVIAEVYAAAMASPDRDLAVFGAYRLLAEFDGSLPDPRFVEMMDASIALMMQMGLSTGHLTGYENRRRLDV